MNRYGYELFFFLNETLIEIGDEKDAEPYIKGIPSLFVPSSFSWIKDFSSCNNMVVGMLFKISVLSKFDTEVRN